jgi:hypothetical protein
MRVAVVRRCGAGGRRGRAQAAGVDVAPPWACQRRAAEEREAVHDISGASLTTALQARRPSG